MDVEFADEMERQINTLNEQQLSALWRWVTVRYMSVCEQRLTPHAPDRGDSSPPNHYPRPKCFPLSSMSKRPPPAGNANR